MVGLLSTSLNIVSAGLSTTEQIPCNRPKETKGRSDLFVTKSGADQKKRSDNYKCNGVNAHHLFCFLEGHAFEQKELY